MKTHPFFLSCLTILLLAVTPGCQNPDSSTPTGQTTVVEGVNESQSAIHSVPASASPTAPRYEVADLSVDLALKPLPKLGEVGELTFTVNTNNEDFYLQNPGTENARIWVEVYYTDTHASYLEAQQRVGVELKDVVVGGDTTWQGNYREKGRIQLRSTLKFSKEGVWTIVGYFSGNGWTTPRRDDIRIAVTKDQAALMSEPTFRSGPLGYLSNFGYGMGDGTKRIDYLNETLRPVVVQLDISKPPRTGEEVTLTCTIASVRDIADFSLQYRVWRRLDDNKFEEATISSLMVEGQTQWQGNLRKGEPTVIQSKLRFPGEGDWRIHAQGVSQEKGGYGDSIDLHVSSITSFYGWPPAQYVPSPATQTKTTTTMIAPTTR